MLFLWPAAPFHLLRFTLDLRGRAEDETEGKMAADVPLLTQDDFLSHLKLQPVTSKAAFAYRHALKER